MPNRTLTPEELKHANKLLAHVRKRLDKLSNGDARLLFAYRRKIAKELQYDERGKPMLRRKLKLQKHAQQSGKCAHCGKRMPLQYSELDRKEAAAGYTQHNTDLVHAKCHQARQAGRKYT